MAFPERKRRAIDVQLVTSRDGETWQALPRDRDSAARGTFDAARFGVTSNCSMRRASGSITRRSTRGRAPDSRKYNRRASGGGMVCVVMAAAAR